MPSPALSVEDIYIAYGRNVVVSGVSFHVGRGETVALAGENGAGKSSLAKVIAGAIRPVSGTLRVNGAPVSLSAPWDALANGIAFIPQELSYAPQLTVAENICMGLLPSRFGFTRKASIHQAACQAAEELGFNLPLRSAMADVSLMQQQLAEILKAFIRKPKVIVLDEPTAAMEAADSARLLKLVDRLARNGVGVVYISHRLDEIFKTCDTIHVLRNGEIALSSEIASTTPAAVTHAMLNRSLEGVLVSKQSEHSNEARLSLSGWNVRAEKEIEPNPKITLTPGEILALYGIRGSGAEALAEALTGSRPEVIGELRIDGKVLAPPLSPAHARSYGITHIPPDRKSQGILPTGTIMATASLPVLRQLSIAGFIRKGKERGRARRITKMLDVKYRTLKQRIVELSGGNQQKVLVGSRTIDSGFSVLVAQEPTRGVDVGSRHDLHLQIRALAEEGLSVVLVTSDLEEAIILADRLLVIHHGRVVSTFSQPSPADQEKVYRAAGGL